MDINEIKAIFPELNIKGYIENKNEICINAETFNNTASCPICNVMSEKIHQKHRKVIQDLPINKKNVIINLNMKVYKCMNPKCSSFSFTERLDLIPSKEKKTKRLIDHIIEITRVYPYRKAALVLLEEGIKLNDSTANKLEKKYRRRGQ